MVLAGMAVPSIRNVPPVEAKLMAPLPAAWADPRTSVAPELIVEPPVYVFGLPLCGSSTTVPDSTSRPPWSALYPLIEPSWSAIASPMVRV